MNFKKKIAVVGGMVALVGATYVNTVIAAENNKIDLTTDKAKLGYSVGVQIATNMKGQNFDKAVSIDAISAALKDVFAGSDLQMTDEQMQQAQLGYQEKLQQEFAALAQNNADSSAAFIEANGKKKGVVSTDSGLQYKVSREGKGKQPTATDTVKVHYEGKLIDGTKFDSSYDRGAPADFPVSGVIPGFSEGLMAMKEGAKHTLFIPASQAYGENGPPSIGPNQALIFEVELIEVVSQADTQTKSQAQ